MSEALRTERIDQVKIQEKVSQKTGKNYYPVSIRILENWFGSILWDANSANDFMNWEGQRKSLIFFEEEYEGKIYPKFKIPKLSDLKIIEIEERVEDLERRLDRAAAKFFDMTKELEELKKKK